MIDKSLPYIIFGAGSAARDWIFSNNNLEILFFVDNDETKWGTNFFNYEVKAPFLLKKYLGKVNILIMSIYVEDIKTQVEKYGFKSDVNVFSKLSTNFYTLNEETTIEKFFSNLEIHNVQYVVLRNYSKLPSNVGGDIDLLVSDNDLDLINKCGLIQSSLTKKSNVINLLKFDIYSVCGSQGFRFRNMAIYPPNKSKRILSNRRKFKNLFYIPSKDDFKWSYLYYVCYFKNLESGIPINPVDSLEKYRAKYIKNSGWYKMDKLASQVRNNFIEECIKLLAEEDRNKLSLSSIHKYLISSGNAPNISTMRRLLGNLDKVEELVESKSSYKKLIDIYHKCPDNFDNVYIYFVRERAKSLGALEHIKNFLKNSSLEILFCHEIKGNINDFSQLVRGGNWFDEKGEFINGRPYYLIFLIDKEKKPLSKSQENFSLPFVKYSSYFIKDKLRNYLFNLFPLEKKINLFHTTDDLLEFLETIYYLSKKDKDIVVDKLIKKLGYKFIFSKL